MEKRLTGDRGEHHLLDRPRDHPYRTALGVGVLTFYVVLFVGGSQDVIAQQLGVSILSVTWALRIIAVVLPLVTAAIAFIVCRDLAVDLPLDEAAAEGEGPVAPAENPVLVGPDGAEPPSRRRH